MYACAKASHTRDHGNFIVHCFTYKAYERVITSRVMLVMLVIEFSFLSNEESWNFDKST